MCIQFMVPTGAKATNTVTFQRSLLIHFEFFFFVTMNVKCWKARVSRERLLKCIKIFNYPSKWNAVHFSLNIAGKHAFYMQKWLENKSEWFQ